MLPSLGASFPAPLTFQTFSFGFSCPRWRKGFHSSCFFTQRVHKISPIFTYLHESLYYPPIIGGKLKSHPMIGSIFWDFEPPPIIFLFQMRKGRVWAAELEEKVETFSSSFLSTSFSFSFSFSLKYSQVWFCAAWNHVNRSTVVQTSDTADVSPKSSQVSRLNQTRKVSLSGYWKGLVDNWLIIYGASNWDRDCAIYLLYKSWIDVVIEEGYDLF